MVSTSSGSFHCTRLLSLGDPCPGECLRIPCPSGCIAKLLPTPPSSAPVPPAAVTTFVLGVCRGGRTTDFFSLLMCRPKISVVDVASCDIKLLKNDCSCESNINKGDSGSSFKRGIWFRPKTDNTPFGGPPSVLVLPPIETTPKSFHSK